MNQPAQQVPQDSTYVAHLWEYPQLTVAIFGIQALSPEGFALYEAAGINPQLEEALRNAEGLLCVRFFDEGLSSIQLQYWRSHEDLAKFARTMPHTAWWKWLTENRGRGFSFFHEIYQCRTAEAIYEVGSIPVGPATFTSVSPVSSGAGLSKERQRRFAEASAK